MNKNFDYKNWESIKKKISQMYPMLTRADLIWRHGTINELLEMIARKLKKTTKELQAEVDNF